jgi:hypothetical protein
MRKNVQEKGGKTQDKRKIEDKRVKFAKRGATITLKKGA